MRILALFDDGNGFNTQPPEGGWNPHPKIKRFRQGFNTQPPEGGWKSGGTITAVRFGFNTQPPEGGWGQLLLFMREM